MFLNLVPVLVFLKILLIEESKQHEFSTVSTTQSPSHTAKVEDRLEKLEKQLALRSELSEQNLQISKPQGSNSQFSETLFQNCKEVQKRGNNVSDIYLIQPKFAPKPFFVLCDMETEGGGWTYFLNRFDGFQDFYLNWDAYKIGFGNLAGEFWLGLEHLHFLTAGAEVNELLVEVVDWDWEKREAHYSAFGIGDENEGFSLKILGKYVGTAGDSFRSQAGCKFSTKDQDQDNYDKNCATEFVGAWWYNHCMGSHLTGKYLKRNVSAESEGKAMFWYGFRGNRYSLKQARMMIRPKEGPIGLPHKN